MATFQQRRAELLVEQERLLTEDFRSLAGRIRDRILARADRDGDLPLSEWSRVESDLTALILGYLLGGVVATPFQVNGDGKFQALSDFARRYDAAVYFATLLALQEQASYVRRAFPADVEHRLQAAPFSPFQRIATLPSVAQRLYGLFEPQYDVRRADNRVLADRMLAAATETRRKTAILLRQLLAERRSAREIADTLSRFLTDGLRVTNQPYGTKGIFDSLRLLLSEAVFAYNRAGVMAAALNPAVQWVEVFTSPAHREIDNCDEMVAGNPYPLDECPVPPYHAHCACGLRFIADGVTEAEITAFREGGMLDIKGALSPDFAQILLRGR